MFFPDYPFLIEDPAFKQAFPAAGIKWNIFGLSVHVFVIYGTKLIHYYICCQVFGRKFTIIQVRTRAY